MVLFKFEDIFMEEQLTEQERVRRDKLTAIRERQEEPYPYHYEPSHTIATLIDKYRYLETGQQTDDRVQIAGRVMAWRGKGKMAFIDLQDSAGRMQSMVKMDRLGEEAYENLKHYDIGDILGIAGFIMKSQRGELSIAAEKITLLSKSLKPLPEKWHGLTDVDTRYRQRYLDLIVNPEVKNTFLVRSQVIRLLREFLYKRDFIEVETPILHSIPGGAEARPFETHHNTLHMDLYLRIAPELYLKRLIVGGFDRVFELNRVFRNEGISTRHNPEFTMLELYQSYADYNDMMTLTEDMLGQIVQTIHGKLTLKYQEHDIDFTPPWPRLTMLDAIEKYTQYTRADFSTLEKSRQTAKNCQLEVKDNYGIGKLVSEVFETVDTQLIQPTFVIDYPKEISPLAKEHRHDPNLTERFELFIAGRELCNAFSELNDPLEQRERFMKQLEAREAGNEEAHQMDEDYVTALEYGLPPTGGWGLGVDRLIMLLTDAASIRDVLLFPHMRPLK